MDGGLGFGMNLVPSSLVAGNQAIEVVAVGTVGAESCFIKQALDAAAQANLIGVILEANWPTHLAVPAPAKDYHSGSTQPGGNYAQRPQPTRLLFQFTHLPQPSNYFERLKTKNKLKFIGVQWSSESPESARFPRTYQRARQCFPPSCAVDVAITAKPL